MTKDQVHLRVPPFKMIVGALLTALVIQVAGVAEFRVAASPSAASPAYEPAPGDAYLVDCEVGSPRIEVSVIPAGSVTDAVPLFDIERSDYPGVSFRGCSTRASWNGSFTRIAVEIEVPGLDGMHVGYVDATTGQMVDLTAAREQSGFGSVEMFDSEPRWFAPSTDRLRFSEDQMVAYGRSADNVETWHVISLSDPTAWLPWATTDAASALEEAFSVDDDDRYQTGLAALISPDGRFKLDGGDLGIDAYILPVTGCDAVCGNQQFLNEACGTDTLVPMGWFNDSTVVMFDYDSDGSTSIGPHDDYSTILLQTVTDGAPGTCTDVLPAHAQSIEDAQLRPDGQVAYVRLEGENEMWYGIDLASPPADPPEYAGPLPSHISGTYGRPSVTGGETPAESNDGSTSTTQLPTAPDNSFVVADELGTSMYSTQYYAMVTGVASAPGSIDVQFEAVGFEDLRRPETSCLVGPSGTLAPTSVTLAVDEAGSYAGTLTFAVTQPGDYYFRYSCQSDYSDVLIGTVPGV